MQALFCWTHACRRMAADRVGHANRRGSAAAHAIEAGCWPGTAQRWMQQGQPRSTGGTGLAEGLCSLQSVQSVGAGARPAQELAGQLSPARLLQHACQHLQASQSRV